MSDENKSCEKQLRPSDRLEQGALPRERFSLGEQGLADIRADLTLRHALTASGARKMTTLGRRHLEYSLKNPPANAKDIEARIAAVQFLVEHPEFRAYLRDYFQTVADREYLYRRHDDRPDRPLPPVHVNLPHQIQDIRDAEGLPGAHLPFLAAGAGAIITQTSLPEYADVSQIVFFALFNVGVYAGAVVPAIYNAARFEHLSLASYLSAQIGLQLKGLPQPQSEFLNDLLAVIGSQRKSDFWLRTAYGQGGLALFLNTSGLGQLMAPLASRRVRSEIESLATLAAAIAELELLTTLADYSAQPGMVKPEILADADHPRIELEEGHHPFYLIDIPKASVPNSLTLGQSVRDQKTVEMLTGPNGFGKSSYIQLVAGQLLLAQLGSYVPARALRFTPLRLLTNTMGPGDTQNHLSKFNQAAQNLALLIERATAEPGLKLILFDEMMDGTSEWERKAIEIAVHKWLSQSNHLAIVATHQRELTSLAERFSNVRLVHVSDSDAEGEKFRVVPGPSQRTNAFEVLRARGVAESLIRDAEAEFEAIKQRSDANRKGTAYR